MKIEQKEKGFVLISQLYFVIIISIIGSSLLLLLVSVKRLQLNHYTEQKAFYAAQSGCEYAIKKILKMNLKSKLNWQETIECGGKNSCKISVSSPKTGIREIHVRGFSGNVSASVTLEILLTDLSEYAVYTNDNPDNVKASPAARSLNNAQAMPYFDLDNLRNNADMNYAKGNFQAADFSSSKSFNFVDGDLIIAENVVNLEGLFIVTGDIIFKKNFSDKIFSNVLFYQTGSGNKAIIENTSSHLRINGAFIRQEFADGKKNGNKSNTSKFLFMEHDPKVVLDFMKYSLNGSPLVIQEKHWFN
jgi:hypothetical protein